MAPKTSDKRGLGRGLSALMGDVSSVNEASSSNRGADRQIPIENIQPNPDQPRRHFDEDALADLSRSIAEKGIIQPIILRRLKGLAENYQIVAGERRWRAAQMAQIHEVPAIIREFTDEEAMEVAIIENIQRDDLNPVEESESYQRLMDYHGRTQEEMSKALGKSRSYIANSLRLLNLPREVLDFLTQGKISAGHARALVPTEDPIGLAKTVVSKGLSVRETERLAKGQVEKPQKPTKFATSEKDADTRALEDELSASVGGRVVIDVDSNGQSGQVTIRYKSLEELDDLCRRLSNVRAGSI